MTRYEQAAEYIIEKMNNGLSPKLYYHNIHHVLDVLNAAERIGIAENISPADLELLKVAVLFHDSGFIVDSENHESTSCDFARSYLPDAGYNENEIEVICRLIMATRVPHAPSSHLEQIICDADLDYLGRDDFFTTGNNMYRELLVHNVVSDFHQWNQMQVKFLSTHSYFTQTSKNLRQAKKQAHLEEVKKLLSESPGSFK